MKRLLLTATLAGALLVPATADAQSPHYVACQWGSSSYTLKAKPRACWFAPYANAPHAAAVPIKNIHWRSWGGREAVGRGTFRANSGYHAPVRFRLYRPRLWEDGIYTYTRLRGVTDPGCSFYVCDPVDTHHRFRIRV